MSEENAETVVDRARGRFASQLDHDWERFLAAAVHHSFRIGLRRPDDFLRHFPARHLMDRLEEQPELRARILGRTTGIKESIALRKSARSSGIDLEIALQEEETDAATVVGLLSPDEIVKALDRERIWWFLTESEFWNAGGGAPEELEVARAHVAFLLECALEEGLVSHRDIVVGLSPDRMAECLPRTVLASVIVRALEEGHVKRVFTEAQFLAVVSPTDLAEYVPLSHIWNEVVVAKIAVAHGLQRGRPAAAVTGSEGRREAAREPDSRAQPEIQRIQVTDLFVDDPEDGFGAPAVQTPLPVSGARKSKRAVTTQIGAELVDA